TLWHFFPDNPEFGLLLARAQVDAGQARTALVTLSALRALPPPRGDDPRIDLVEAAAATKIGDIRHRLAAAEQVVRRARARDEKLTLALGLEEAGWAHYLLGEREAAVAAFEESLRLASEVRAPRAQSYASLALGVMRSSGGDNAGARPFYEEALRLRRGSGGLAGPRGSLGELSFLEGDAERVEDARRHIVEATALAREIGSDAMFSAARSFGAVVELAAGNAPAALAAAKEALAGYDQSGNALLAGRARLLCA